jgi:hypothetical protein
MESSRSEISHRDSSPSKQRIQQLSEKLHTMQAGLESEKHARQGAVEARLRDLDERLARATSAEETKFRLLRDQQVSAATKYHTIMSTTLSHEPLCVTHTHTHTWPRVHMRANDHTCNRATFCCSWLRCISSALLQFFFSFFFRIYIHISAACQRDK